MRWWKYRHSKLILRISQALESTRARGLCAENIKSFYDNLEELCTLYRYSPYRTWNCDESIVQAERNGGGLVIAKTGLFIFIQSYRINGSDSLF